MLFTQALRDTIHNKFIENLPLGLQNDKILRKLDDCNEDERIIMEFFYSTMPASDIGDYDFSLYKKFAAFGILLAETSQWRKLVPEDIFFNFVLQYRINNEGIEDCRPFFNNALKDRIKGKNMKEAALEVNVWCAEHVTYQATDERTAAPMTVLRSSYGRCGEESTLVVTAMRSVGIPARQVYTPRWAHCDDNHAWVEVWCDGDWYYLGACEPEPVLNRGWFNNAAARAMLVDGKAFLPVSGEEVITSSGQTLIMNEISRYAPSRYFSVKITKDSLPVPGVAVHFEMLNGSEFFPLASVVTDEAGCAGLTLGFGSIHIHAVKDQWFVEAIADTSETECVALDFAQAVQTEQEGQVDFNFSAPKDSMRNNIQLTEDQRALRHQIITLVNQKRKAYAEGFYNKEKADRLAAKFKCPQEVLNLLKAAEGNFNEIYDFLAMDFDIGNKELQLSLLKSLQKKDYRDVQCSVLAEHFRSALDYLKDYPLEVFIAYVMCPRIHYEQLTQYRELISGFFDREAKAAFRKEPKQVWEYVKKYQISPTRFHERLIGTPEGILRSGFAGVMGKKLIFTAICRTLGIPARINPVDMSVQYYSKGEFKNAEDFADETDEYSKLTILGGTEKWFYLNNWTIAVLREGTYQTLELADYSWTDGRLELSLQPGSYRLITSNRTPNGNQFSRKYCFKLEKGVSKTIAISLRKAEITDLLTDIPFSPFEVYNGSSEVVSIDKVIGEKTSVLVWVEEGHEPTEHILNEFIQARDILNKMSCEIVFIARASNALGNETLRKAYESLRGARLYYSDFADTAETMARRMYVNTESFPLTVVAQGSRGIYACSGYNVGIAGLLIKILNL